DCWYGINGSTGRPDQYPFVRVPTDSGAIFMTKLNSTARHASRMPAVFYGFSIHNKKDERINARHSRDKRTHNVFFVWDIASFGAFRLPSVTDINAAAEVRWPY